MKFLMFVCSDLAPDDKPEAPGEIEAWVEDGKKRRKLVAGSRLRPKGEAKTVRVRKGKRLVTDGPYTEAKEVIVGFDILECESMDDAIEIASRHPMARAGRLELRAFWPFEE
jgi:hypothetical protein